MILGYCESPFIKVSVSGGMKIEQEGGFSKKDGSFTFLKGGAFQKGIFIDVL